MNERLDLFFVNVCKDVGGAFSFHYFLVYLFMFVSVDVSKLSVCLSIKVCIFI